VNNNDYTLLIGDTNARVGNNKLFCLKSLIEKQREYNLETHLLFVEYEKAFDIIQRLVLFDILKSRNIPDTLLTAIVDIHTQKKI